LGGNITRKRKGGGKAKGKETNAVRQKLNRRTLHKETVRKRKNRC